MAAPEYVPQEPVRLVRTYESPPWRPDPWVTERPGDLADFQPRGERFGTPGPDQGYVYVLARRFEGTLHLAPGEHERDALFGACMVALKRASLFGRAPVIHDVRVGLTVWGFLDADAPAELRDLRRRLFAEVGHPHHYTEQRQVAAMIPDEVLRRTPEQVLESYRENWRSVLDLELA